MQNNQSKDCLGKTTSSESLQVYETDEMEQYGEKSCRGQCSKYLKQDDIAPMEVISTMSERDFAS